MAAMSTVQTATTLTPPSSSHDNANGFPWDFTTAKAENHHHYARKNTLKLEAASGTYRSPPSQNGNSSGFSLDTSAKASNGGDQVNGPGALSRSYTDEDDDTLDDRPDNIVTVPFDEDYSRNNESEHPHKGPMGQGGYFDEDAGWIHRDKLVKIENEELQAAGIIYPQSRSRSRPSRERSQSSTKRLNQDNLTRSRKNSFHALEPKTPDANEAVNFWDSRGAEEMDSEADGHIKPAGGSRIPVPKKSPLHIPTQQHHEHDRSMKGENSPDDLDRHADAPKARSRANSTTLKSLEPSPHLRTKRAATMADTSPKKPIPRKAPGPTKTIPPEARGKVRPKGKNGQNGTRPSTRSGDRELSSGSTGSRPMEGDPPWMVSAYRPDPRLPPDQQLLPTVARRLQQEKWEQEGKFGNVYDKDFRPLTDEGFLPPPSNKPSSSSEDNTVSGEDNPVSSEDNPVSSEDNVVSSEGNMVSSEDNTVSSEDNVVKQEAEKPAEDWPLRSPEQAKNTISPARSSSYSTMPRIQDNQPVAPHASPKAPAAPVNPPEPIQITRVPDIPEKETGKKEKDGCGCCIVM